MAVDFDRDRMEAVLDAHERWWRGELDRPLVKVVLEKDLPRVRALCQANCHEVDRPAEAVVDAIDEELSRLESHIAQFRDSVENGMEVGRKLDFLIQEMNREINTIGSKASDGKIAQCVVSAKCVVEKLREQVQNAV